MVGLDRASVWVRVDAETDLILLGIQKAFPGTNVKRLAGRTQTYEINKKNINFIKIEEKLSHRIVKIDFSYPRGKIEDNVYPIDNEIDKLLIEQKIIVILESITLEEIPRYKLNYDYIELCVQEEVGSFYKYHNIINIFYKSLSRKFDDNDAVQYGNYSKKEDRFYTTGFIFSPYRGYKIRLYSKLHEHNKKHEKKRKRALLRMEHRITQYHLKVLFDTSRVEDLTIEMLKEKISKTINKRICEYMVEEIERNNEILEKKLLNFNSRELEKTIKDLQEWILDKKIVDDIITNTSDKCYRQIKNYRAKIKKALEESQTESSPKRDNFGNIERLDTFFNKILLIDTEVKCNTKKHLTITFGKKGQ